MFNLSETAKTAVTMTHSQQLELFLEKRTELICISNNYMEICIQLKTDNKRNSRD